MSSENTNENVGQEMSYEEREDLKRFSRKGENLEQTLIMISHWMRQSVKVRFTEYAASWAAADTSNAVSAMRTQWPLIGPIKIGENKSDWLG